MDMDAEPNAIDPSVLIRDERALTDIYTTFSPRLYRHAYRLLGEPADAEELVAETFHRFLASIRRGAGPHQHISGYLFRILHNLITDRFRRSSPGLVAFDDDIADGVAFEDVSERRQGQARARALLLRLTPEQRFVITLKYFEGLGNEEIAAVMGKHVGTIKALQHRGLEAMRRALTREGWTAEEVLA